MRRQMVTTMYNNKQLLDEVSVISRIIKVSVRVISRGRGKGYNCFIISYNTLNEKNESYVSASSLKGSNTARANFT